MNHTAFKAALRATTSHVLPWHLREALRIPVKGKKQ